jgi:hypothetical protein
MKCRGILVILLSIFLITPSIISNTENEETTSVQIALITPSENKLLEKTIPLDQAERLRDLCKTYYPNPADNQELIDEFSSLLLQNEKYSKEELIKLLTPPKYQQSFHNNLGNNYASSPSASEFFCTIASGGSGRTFPFFLLPRPRLFLLWNGNSQNDIAGTTAGSLIRDRGFIALGGQNGYAIGFIGVGLSYGTPAGRFYAFTGYCLFTSVIAEIVQAYYPLNRAPEISDPQPSDNENNVPLSLKELSFRISDDDNDFMGYTVTTDPYIGIGSGNLKRDGTYSIPVSNLDPSTEYSWTVKVDDGKESSTQVFRFNAIKAEPEITNQIPGNYESVETDIAEISFELTDAQGDLMDYTVETSPDIGSGGQNGVFNGTYTIPIDGLVEDNWYHYYVNVTDGEYWTKEKYSFFTGDLGLIGYWAFDEGIGYISYDSSYYNHHGELHGPTWVAGKYGNALYFDGDDYIALNEVSDLKPDLPVTISAWIKPSDFELSEDRQQIFLNDHWKQTGISNYNGVRLSVTSNGEIITAFGDGGNGPSGRRTKISDEKILINNWYHIVGVIIGPKDMDIYINGKISGGDYTGSGGSLYYTNSPGRVGSNSDNLYYFNGVIDELRVYDRALSENEINSLYENRS